MTWVWDQDLPPNLKIVLLAIADHSNDQGCEAYPSQDTLSHKTGYTVRQVRRIIDQLVEVGLLEVTKACLPGRRGDRQPNLYQINMVTPVPTRRSTRETNVTQKETWPATNGRTSWHQRADIWDTHGRTSMSSYPSIEPSIETSKINLLPTEVGVGLAAHLGNGSETVILGQDPDDQPTEVKAPAKRPVSDLTGLVGHFVRHPAIVMLRRYSQQDTMILRKSLKALLDAGVTRTTVVAMIDKFYATERFRTAERPVLLFSKKDLQQELLVAVNGSTVEADPVLALLQQDFHRPQGLDLPWSSELDAVLRSVVMRNCFDACFRYPELVAALISHFADDFHNVQFAHSLDTLEILLSKTADEYDTDNLQPYVDTLASIISLPKELMKPSIKTLRKDADTIEEAIYAYRRSSNVRR